MKKLMPYLLHLAAGSGVIASHWYGITEAGNVAIAAIWLLILLALVAYTGAFGSTRDMEDTSTTKFRKYTLGVFFAGNVIVLFMAGWFITGFALLIARVLVWVMDQNSLEK